MDVVGCQNCGSSCGLSTWNLGVGFWGLGLTAFSKGCGRLSKLWFL